MEGIGNLILDTCIKLMSIAMRIKPEPMVERKVDLQVREMWE